jgi:3D (Asp-Asp-Asp) domain-containing protein
MMVLALLGWLTAGAAAGREMVVVATAYTHHGATASGIRAHSGIIAADPRILPLGSIVKVTHAGAYSGNYTVADTGGRIRGRRIDFFMPSDYEARRFGRRTVVVTMLRQPRLR